MFEAAMKFVPEPSAWLREVWEIILRLQLPGTMQAIGVALLVLGVIWTGLRISTLGGTDELQPMMVRLLIAGAVVFSSVSFSGQLRGFWASTYRWGTVNIVRPETTKAAEAMEPLMTSVGTVIALATFLVPVTKIASGAAKVGSLAEGAGVLAKDGSQVVGKASDAAEWLALLALPLIATFYISILLAGFAVYLASLILPVVGALLIFPNRAVQGIAFSWSSTTASALLITAFMPVVFAAALHLSFVIPGQAFKEQLDIAAQQLQTAANELGQAAGISNSPECADCSWNPFARFIDQFGSALNALTGALSSLWTFVVGMLAGVIMMIIGIIAGGAIMKGAQGWIASLIGGVAGSGTDGGASAALRGVIGGLRSVAGGVGQRGGAGALSPRATTGASVTRTPGGASPGGKAPVAGALPPSGGAGSGAGMRRETNAGGYTGGATVEVKSTPVKG